MRRIITAIAAALILGLSVWAFLPRPVAVELAEVAPRTIDVFVEEEGEARILEVYTVSANISGKLRRISLHAGDPVIAGESVVASIGPAAPALLDARARAVAEASVAAAQAAVDLAKAQKIQADATLDFMNGDADRARALYERSAISERVLDNAILAQKTALAATESAMATLAVRERELDSALAILNGGNPSGVASCCVDLVAPVSGRVLRVLTESEQVVQAGTPILEIGNPSNLEVVVDLLSRDAVHVTEGAQARITAWGGTDILARVRRVEPIAETSISALGIDERRVKVSLDLLGNPAQWHQLGHGFRVVVQIELWRGEDVLSIPVGALFRNGPDWATYVVRDRRAKLQVISIGERNQTQAHLLEGLMSGDKVILHPSDQIADGTRVLPQEQ